MGKSIGVANKDEQMFTITIYTTRIEVDVPLAFKIFRLLDACSSWSSCVRLVFDELDKSTRTTAAAVISCCSSGALGFCLWLWVPILCLSYLATSVTWEGERLEWSACFIMTNSASSLYYIHVAFVLASPPPANLKYSHLHVPWEGGCWRQVSK